MDSFLDFDVALAQVAALTGTQPEIPEPGAQGDSCLFKSLPAHLYHADRDALSCSMLKPLLVSPAHFQAGLTACGRSSDAMEFGTLVHLLVLQPHEVSSELAVYPGVADRSAGFKQFVAAHSGRLVLDEPTFAQGRRVAAKVMDTPYKGRPLQRFLEESIPEATIYFTEPTTGLRMRIRVDALHPDVSFDLKTTRFPAARAFARDAVDKDYDLQAFMYSFGRCMYEGTSQAKPFVFITAESTAPHSVSTLVAADTFLGNGSLKFQSCAATFKACAATGLWPDLGSAGVLEIEPWQQFNASVGWRQALGALSD